MLGQFNPPIEALTVAAATIDLIRERRSQMNFVLAREVVTLAGPDVPLDFSESVWLARQLIDGLIDLVDHGAMTATLDDRFVTLGDRLGRDHVRAAFHSAFHLIFGAQARPMIVNAWCDVLAACCALSAQDAQA